MRLEFQTATYKLALLTATSLVGVGVTFECFYCPITTLFLARLGAHQHTYFFRMFQGHDWDQIFFWFFHSGTFHFSAHSRAIGLLTHPRGGGGGWAGAGKRGLAGSAGTPPPRGFFKIQPFGSVGRGAQNGSFYDHRGGGGVVGLGRHWGSYCLKFVSGESLFIRLQKWSPSIFFESPLKQRYFAHKSEAKNEGFCKVLRKGSFGNPETLNPYISTIIER
jgi:hypothetical protein